MGLKFENLVTLGCIMFSRACVSWVHCVPYTVGGPRRSSSCEVSGKLREPPLIVELALGKFYGFDQRPLVDLIVD